MPSLHLPIADSFFNPFTLLLIGFGGGVVSNILRIGGGIFVTPMLVMLGVPPLVAFPSQLNHAIGTNLLGFCVHWKRYDVDLAMAWYLFLGGIIGAIIEMLVYHMLSGGHHITQKLNIIYLVILTIVGITMFIVHMRMLRVPKKKKATVTMKRWMIHLPAHRVFLRSRVEVSLLIPLGIGIVTGLLTTLLGGAVSMIIMPAVSYLIGRSSPVIAGTSRLASFAIAIVVALIQSWHFAVADWVLVSLLLIGSTIGSYWGRRFSAHVPQAYLGIGGAIAILILATQFLYSLFIPSQVIAPTLKLNLSALEYLKSLVPFAQGSQKSMLELAISHPLYYTWMSIIGVTTLSFIFYKIFYRKFE